MANSTETRSQITIPPLALPKSGTVEDLSSSQPVTQAPAGSFLFFNIAHTYPVVKPPLLIALCTPAGDVTVHSVLSNTLRDAQNLC